MNFREGQTFLSLSGELSGQVLPKTLRVEEEFRYDVPEPARTPPPAQGRGTCEEAGVGHILLAHVSLDSGEEANKVRELLTENIGKVWNMVA